MAKSGAILLTAAVSVGFGTALVTSHAAGGASSQAHNKQTSSPSLAFDLPDYTKIPANKAEQQTTRTLEQWEAATSKLVMQVEDPETPKAAKAETMYLLGALRASDAVTALIENINFFDDRILIKTGRSDRGDYIARRALAQIGEPPARWIYLIIANDHNLNTVRFNKSQIEGFAEVLSRIETPEIALLKLKKGLAQTKDTKIKAQYHTVIAAIEKAVAVDAALVRGP